MSLPSVGGMMEEADVFTMDHAENKRIAEKGSFMEELEPDFSQAVSRCEGMCACVCARALVVWRSLSLTSHRQ